MTDRLSEGVHWFSPTIPVHVFDAPGEARERGPTALVQAGIHGDEIAGIHALEDLLERGLRPRRGRLIVIPRMNPPADRAGARTSPGGLDLNRCFPGDADAPERERRLAHRYIQLCLDERPALVVTLHESRKRYDPAVVPSFGQSVVYGVQPPPPVVGELVARMNADFPDPVLEFAPLHYPVATSSTEMIVDAIGCTGLCLETWMSLPTPLRAAMHRRMVLHLLRAFDVVDDADVDAFSAPLAQLEAHERGDDASDPPAGPAATC